MTYLPPQDVEAERALLACLLSGHPIIDDVADMLQGRDFYSPHNESVWDACVAVHAAGGRVDPLTLPLPAKARPYVMELVTSDLAVVPVQAPSYAQKILDAALRRRMVEASQHIAQVAQSDMDPMDAAEDAKQTIEAATSQAGTEAHGVTAGEALAGALDWLEQDQSGVPTPWEDVDRLTHGMHDGQMVTIAARPGVGKSVVAKDLAVHTARRGLPVHLVTLEMSRNDYMARIISGVAKVDLGRMLARKMSEGDWQRVAEASDMVTKLPIYLDDRPAQSMAQIRAGARMTKRRMGGLGLVAIDYLQLVKPRDLRMPRQEQVAEMSRTCKLLAKELECPVVVLAQLNRGSAERTDKRPLLTDLRESGSIEQDSDQVWLLHRPDMYNPDERMGELDVIIAKNRNGAMATAALVFQGHYARAVSYV
jgi:replicative DNA helicase